MAETTLLTEAEMLAFIKAQAKEKGVQGLARELGVNPGDVSRVINERNSVGRALPAAMGFGIRYVRES